MIPVWSIALRELREWSDPDALAETWAAGKTVRSLQCLASTGACSKPDIGKPYGRRVSSHETSSTTQSYAARRKWQYDIRPQGRKASRINRKIVSVTIDCAKPR